MDTENLGEASAQAIEPAATETIEPVTDTLIEEAPAEAEPAESQSESTEAPEVEATADTDDDPLAEFENNAIKDESYYDRLFKTEKWKHVPHTARDEIRALVKDKADFVAVVEGIGGQPMLDTFKPVSAAILNPDPTDEEVDAAFDAIDTHNPKVLMKLGATFTKNWVQEVAKDPVQHLSPLLQYTFGQYFGQAGQQYDLNRVLEFIQLDMMRDADGDPVLDLDAARQLFEANGGIPTFKYQQEKAEYERQIQELKTGYQKSDTALTSTSQIDVDADLEKEILPKIEAIVTKVGYTKDDPEFSLFMDAVKYRIRHSPEAERIRGFAKNGNYKTSTGDYVQGVGNNRTYLMGRIPAQFLSDLRSVQNRRKGASPPATKAEITLASEQKAVQQIEQKTVQRSNAPFNREDFITRMKENAKNRDSDVQSANAIAAGR